jgi:DNA-binding transcriptional MerR regulator
MPGGSTAHRTQDVVNALLVAPTIRAAAKLTGVSDRTIRRWRKQPAFRECLDQAQRQVGEWATIRRQQAMAQALETLAQNLAEGGPLAQRRAALDVLEYSKGNREVKEALTLLKGFIDLFRRMQKQLSEVKGQVADLMAGQADGAESVREERQHDPS